MITFRRPKVPAAAPRPICSHCGQVYGQRATEQHKDKYKEGTLKPPYRGNGIVVYEREWHVGGGLSGNTSGSPGSPAIQYGPGDVVIYRDVWDGVSYWGGYKPFCTQRCALDYARKAFKKWGPLPTEQAS